MGYFLPCRLTAAPHSGPERLESQILDILEMLPVAGAQDQMVLDRGGGDNRISGAQSGRQGVFFHVDESPVADVGGKRQGGVLLRI